MEMSQSLSQKLGMSQQQVQSLRILEMGTEALEAMIQKEEMENPFFEVSAPATPQESDRQELQWLSSSNRAPAVLSIENDVAIRQQQSRACNTLEETLWQQINWDQHTALQQHVLQALLKCVDGHGFISESSSELADILKVSEKQAVKALQVIQSLEPVGVGTRNVGHCLAVQLRQGGVTNPKLLAIPMQHLEDLAKGHFGVVGEKVGLPTAQVKSLFQQLRNLSPYPWTQEETQSDGYVIPDALCHHDADGWHVEINDKWMGSVGLSDYYCKMAQNTEDAALSEYAMRKINAAKFMMRCIEKRRDTMLQVLQLIVEEQSDYLLHGGALKPLNMKQIADRLEMHPSTISRAVKHKYLQCRRGCFALQDLLTVAISQQEERTGATLGRQQVLDLLQTMIAEEDKTKPLSDQEIVVKMAEKDIKVSRRTIAKYRDMLGVAGTFQRKIQ